MITILTMRFPLSSLITGAARLLRWTVRVRENMGLSPTQVQARIGSGLPGGRMWPIGESWNRGGELAVVTRLEPAEESRWWKGCSL